MKLASEKNLNKFAFPLFNIKGRIITTPCVVEHSSDISFACDQGTFGPNNMMILDILGTYLIHHVYNLKDRTQIDFGCRIPTSNDGRVKRISSNYISYKLLKYVTNRFRNTNDNGIVPTFLYSDEGNLNGIDGENTRTKKVITLKVTDSYLKEQLPFLKAYSSQQICDMIKQTSETKLRMNYPIRFYDGKNYQNFPYNNYNENGSCSFFTLLNVSNSNVSKDNHILAREYEISFNTFLGYWFVQNCVSCYTDLLPGKFYLMSDYAQLFYRLLILPYFNGVKNPISVDEIRKRLVFKTKDTYMVRKVIKRILDELESNSFIRDPKEDKLNGKYMVSYSKTPWKEIEK
jgi:hypothetical protein